MIALQHIHAISSAEGPYCVLQKFNEHDHLKTQEALKLSFRASSLALVTNQNAHLISFGDLHVDPEKSYLG